MKTLISLIVSFVLLLSAMPYAAALENSESTVIELSSKKSSNGYTHSVKVDGKRVNEYDYVWHIDPASIHNEVKNSPAEYYTGAKPKEDTIYIAHDIYYYPMLEQSKFKQVNYDGETEWVYHYQSEEYKNFIFSTLPILKTGFPEQMMHSAEDAYQNAVLHITKPGNYTLKGEWHGQIKVDLGEEAFADESQKVTLILDGVNITCDVSSGIIFENVYECDNTWEERDKYSQKIDTSAAGANIVIKDNSENNVSGTNIFRILKTKYKDEASNDEYPAQKKRLKVDGALYSYQSLNISGEDKGTGILNITSGYEGLNSELHLTVNGGNVNIFSQDDGINVNEDGVSVLTVNDGRVHICAGLGAEGDGVDSNGFVVINGGTFISAANPASDSGLDSDCGSFVNGGTVVALGSTMDWAKSDDNQNSRQAILNLRFASSISQDNDIIITDTKDNVVFAYSPDKDEVTSDNLRSFSGAIVSCYALKLGESYSLYLGGEITGEEIGGIYDVSSITSFTNAEIQCYSENSLVGNRFERPENAQNIRPENKNGEMQNAGEQPPEPPQEGNAQFDNFKDKNENIDFPHSFSEQALFTCNGKTDFTLSETVNAFSNISTFKHTLEKSDNSEHYTCSVCGKTFADEDGKKQIKTLSDFKYSTISYVLTFLGGVLITSIVFFVILLLKNKKQVFVD
ncbi:MAG: carbohydrate-binding domain-containing protein [Clostridia bacterium]|nr:carbohydrate-binding domain-containing protein [Clostridia bacterium]